MTTWHEVTEERYDEMLGCVPPLMFTSGGFLVGEAWRHVRCSVTGRDDTPAFAAFIRCHGKFYEADQPMTPQEFKAVDRRTLKLG